MTVYKLLSSQQRQRFLPSPSIPCTAQSTLTLDLVKKLLLFGLKEALPVRRVNTDVAKRNELMMD